MVGFREALEEGIRRAFCTALGTSNRILDFFQDNLGLPTGAALGAGRLAYRLICDREPEPDRTPDDGSGQCPGVQYGYLHRYRFRTSPEEPWQFDVLNRPCPQSVFGRISRPQVETIDGLKGIYIRAFDNIGQPLVREVSFTTSNADIEFESLQFQAFRCDGQPDNCGEPEEPTVPPDYNNIDINITFDIGGGGSTSLPINIEFLSPQLNINNEIVIPLNIRFTDPLVNVTVNATANFNVSIGEINFNIGGNSGGDDRGGKNPDKTEPTEPPPPPPPDSNAPDQDEDDDQSRVTILRAVLVNITQIDPTISVIFQRDGQPDIYAPNLGFVHFKVRVGRTATAWLADIPVKNRRQLIPCPYEQGAIDVVWTPRGSTQGTLTPIRFREDRPRREPV